MTKCLPISGIAILTSIFCGKSPEIVEFAGDDLTKKVVIIRDKYSKEAKVEVAENIDLTLYSGPSADSIDFSKVLVKSDSAGVFHLNVSITYRSYFFAKTSIGKAIIAERQLPMNGGYNFRDLGGYRTSNGQFVKWGKFIRSDEMNSLTENDLSYLASLPLVSIVDFRSEKEISNKPDKLPANIKNTFIYPIEPGSIGEILNESKSPDKQYFHNMMAEINRMLVTNEQIIGIYREFFKLAQNEENIPLLFHCSAGKDRTGMAAALILLALGVDEQTVMQDYMLSNDCLDDKYISQINAYPEIEPLMVVHTDYLEAGLNAIKEQFGSVENFLIKELDVNIEAFRNMFLY